MTEPGGTSPTHVDNETRTKKKKPIDRNFDVVDKIVELLERMDVSEVRYYI